MTQRNTRMFAGVAGAALLLTGSGLALNALNPNSADASDAASGMTHSFNENVVEASWVNVDDGSYVRVPNVQGSFVFNQLGTTPNDELFNVFGAALTSMCSKPAVELEAQTGGVANFYVNVGGHIKKNFTVDVSELSEDASEEALMACSCATGSPFGQAAVLGVPLASIVEMADLEEGVNTVTAYGADGFGQPLPLRYALEHDAMLVYQVNGQELTSATDGSSMHYAGGCTFVAGDEITFEGVADDLGSPIEAIEFSFDGGATWTSCATEGATADKWVNWQFSTSFEDAGDYRMTVRAKTADGMVSPLAATLLLQVS